MWTSSFRLWSDLWSSAFTMAETGARFVEMAQASSEVIDARSRTLFDACCDPLRGDYGELGRMVPEKLGAAWQAGAASLGDIGALQAEMIAGWQQAASLALAGRPPTPAEIAASARRAGRMARRSAAAGAKALAPVHQRATGNARRLRKPKR